MIKVIQKLLLLFKECDETERLFHEIQFSQDFKGCSLLTLVALSSGVFLDFALGLLEKSKDNFIVVSGLLA